MSQDGLQFLLPPYATQQMAPGRSDSSSNRQDNDSSHSLWVDLYEPKHENEIAVRKQKMDEVKFYLESSCLAEPPGQYKILALTGPSGCGKSTLIRILGKSMGCEVLDWTSPTADHYLEEGYESAISKFEEFLRRSIQLGTLGHASRDTRRKIILMDDIPDITTESVKYRFHALLQMCLSSSNPFLLVLVISEAWMKSGYNARLTSDTRLTTIRDLIPHSVTQSGHCGIVEFNPITRTEMKKALNRIQSLEFKKTRRRLAGDQILEIGELSHGDLRCAINTLQFYSIPQHDTDTRPSRKRKTSENQSLSGRGAPLDLFHALGKVFYAKRDEHGELESKPETIFNALPCGVDMFLAYMHENYLKYQDDIAESATAMAWLCEADHLAAIGDWQTNIAEEYQALLSMRGFMSTRTTPIAPGKKIQVNKPTFYVPSFHAKDLDMQKARMTCTPDYTKDIQEDPSAWDDDIVESFSEDEYDDVFGDGSALAGLEYGCP